MHTRNACRVYSSRSETERKRDPPPFYIPNQQYASEVKFSEETQRRLARLREHRFHPTNIPDSPDFGTNQYINIDEKLKEQLKRILTQFNAPIRYAFAYGSGVFQQAGYQTQKPMLDFIFGVMHPDHWHALNIQQNPHHYSALKGLGNRAITSLQEKIGAGLYFNPYVEMDGMMIKYGVVSVDMLCKDLLDWDTLYLSGRMHKPIKILRDDPRVRLANQVNLTEAVRVALLTLPEEFTEEELYKQIAGISYVGDYPIFVGENPNKVKNIVEAQMSHFHRLYSGLLNDLPNVTFLGEGKLQQSQNPRFRGLMVQKLPANLYRRLVLEHRKYAAQCGLSVPEESLELNQQIALSPALQYYFEKCLHDIIARPALTQSIKDIFTAGPLKTSRHVSSKMSKWLAAQK
ncbi:Mitochondrial translocator assembly and maintenance protein 41 [Apophysomyces ossiformis]|uniref:Phosphatidate cytidylyltransferase, mitochondrial n=1 Tax=Apophysomyces ossiformis TaxID=679940 RepID=A0A8H7BNC6_9FUNG|nr:Mitochondrial translocator assembly and maintenance protein 41 [Apophysomyces ossiformis]